MGAGRRRQVSRSSADTETAAVAGAPDLGGGRRSGELYMVQSEVEGATEGASHVRLALKAAV